MNDPINPARAKKLLMGFYPNTTLLTDQVLKEMSDKLYRMGWDIVDFGQAVQTYRDDPLRVDTKTLQRPPDVRELIRIFHDKTKGGGPEPQREAEPETYFKRFEDMTFNNWIKFRNAWYGTPRGRRAIPDDVANQHDMPIGTTRQESAMIMIDRLRDAHQKKHWAVHLLNEKQQRELATEKGISFAELTKHVKQKRMRPANEVLAKAIEHNQPEPAQKIPVDDIPF